ncbi:MAG: hypothetical protein WCI55_04470 [Armatimonadota bacterium]
MVLPLFAFTCLYQVDSLSVFPSTISPQKKWGVAHYVAKGKDPDEFESQINTLVNLQTQTPVMVLKGFQGMEHENHGGMSAAYSKDEREAVVIHLGRWEPHELAIVAPNARLQRDILKMVLTDSKNFAMRHRIKPRGPKVVFDVTGAKFNGNKVTLTTIGEVPKSADDPTTYLSITYSFRNTKSRILMGKPSIRVIPEKYALQWAE